MKNKNIRHQAIKEVILSTTVRNQDDLLQLLTKKGFVLTQATLSRDLKQLKVAKQPTEKGDYTYVLPTEKQLGFKMENNQERDFNSNGKGFLSIDFSANTAVIKTRPGYAGSIAYDIDAASFPEFLGSIAGDDTILLIIRENVSKEVVLEVLSSIIPGIR